MYRFVRLLLVTVAAALALVAAGGAASPPSAEQIVFSGTGLGTFAGFQQPFGFWIWCEGPGVSNPYAANCAGSMYFYGSGITEGVFADDTVYENGDGSYTLYLTFAAPPPFASVACWLTNEVPVRSGPHNTVDVTCTAPVSGSGQSTNSVVKLTGPST